MPSSTHFDAVVIGVGTMGSMTAWRLAQRGANVLGIERFEIGHQRGAAGGETRIFRTAYKEGRQYIPLLEHCHQLWSDLATSSGENLLTPTGALTIGAAEHPEVREVIAGAREHALELDVLDTSEARSRYPQHQLYDGEVAVLDPSGGVLRPTAAIQAAVRVAKASGATVWTDTNVRQVLAEPDQVRVVLDDGDVTADRVVVSLGPWTHALLPEVGRRFEVRRSVLNWFSVSEPDLFRPDSFPVGLRRSGRGKNLSFFPSMDGCTIKVNLHIAKQAVPDPENFDGTIPAEYSAQVSAGIVPLFNGLEPTPVRAAGFMEGYSPDNHGLIGELGDKSNVIALAGFSGHGFKMSPVIGDVAADLVLHGSTKHDISHMELSRPAGIATAQLPGSRSGTS